MCGHISFWEMKRVLLTSDTHVPGVVRKEDISRCPSCIAAVASDTRGGTHSCCWSFKSRISSPFSPLALRPPLGELSYLGLWLNCLKRALTECLPSPPWVATSLRERKMDCFLKHIRNMKSYFVLIETFVIEKFSNLFIFFLLQQSVRVICKDLLCMCSSHSPRLSMWTPRFGCLLELFCDLEMGCLTNLMTCKPPGKHHLCKFIEIVHSPSNLPSIWMVSVET